MIKQSLWCKIIVLMLVLILAIPMVMACDDGNDDKTTQPLKTMTQPLGSIDPSFVDEPVKIGVVLDWSGPNAMAGFLADGVIEFADWYWNQKQGGIQVGNVRRPVEFLKYDNQGQASGAAVAAKKALLDGVVAVTHGGISTSFGYPVADVTDPEKVLFATFLSSPDMFGNYYKFTVDTQANAALFAGPTADFIVNKLGAKTIAILGHQLESDRVLIDGFKKKITALDPDIKIVCEDWHPLDTKDLSPYLTKIKYKNPDVLLTIQSQDAYMAMAGQIMALGGWGDIKHVAYTVAASFPGFEKMQGMQGCYISTSYLQGYGSPAQREFDALWAEKCAADPGWCKKYSPNGSVPMTNGPIMYLPLIVAIKAIELAGSDDRYEIAKVARSGKLEFDSPQGYYKVDSDGQNSLSTFWIQVKDGEAVPLE